MITVVVLVLSRVKTTLFKTIDAPFILKLFPVNTRVTNNRKQPIKVLPSLSLVFLQLLADSDLLLRQNVQTAGPAPSYHHHLERWKNVLSCTFEFITGAQAVGRHESRFRFSIYRSIQGH